MERHFEKELGELNKKIIEMGSKAEEMIRLAIQALVERNMDVAARLLVIEQEVNHMQIEVDEMALRLLATQQPMAIDLRFLVTAIKINSQLERIGDQAVNIYESTEILLQHPPLKPLLDRGENISSKAGDCIYACDIAHISIEGSLEEL